MIQFWSLKRETGNICSYQELQLFLKSKSCGVMKVSKENLGFKHQSWNSRTFCLSFWRILLPSSRTAVNSRPHQVVSVSKVCATWSSDSCSVSSTSRSPKIKDISCSKSGLANAICARRSETCICLGTDKETVRPARPNETDTSMWLGEALPLFAAGSVVMSVDTSIAKKCEKLQRVNDHKRMPGVLELLNWWKDLDSLFTHGILTFRYSSIRSIPQVKHQGWEKHSNMWTQSQAQLMHAASHLITRIH